MLDYILQLIKKKNKQLKILLSAPRGFCAGVERAIEIVEKSLQKYGAPVYVRHEIVHNKYVVDDLKNKGAVFVEELEEIEDKSRFSPAKYVMITGDKSFSPNNLADLKHITDPDNKNGENVKVILITKAAAEGLDFKNIRQVHIMEPWYNSSRIEQITGRTVRNLSHCMLPFEERNVEIYLHGTQLSSNEEASDLYVYRYAETKAIQIGHQRSKAQVEDTFIYRKEDTLLSRSAWIDGLGLAVKSATIFPHNSIVSIPKIDSFTNEYIEVHKMAISISRSYRAAVLEKLGSFNA